MAIDEVLDLARALPTVRRAPGKTLWMTYDEEVDVLYINFRKPSIADDSELSDDDVITRFSGDEIIGYTILNASHRNITSPLSSGLN